MTKHGDVLLRCTGSDGFVHASINFANLAFSSGYFRGMHEVFDDDSEMDVPALPYNESRLNGCSMKSASDAKRAQLLFVAHKFETGYDNPDLTLLYLFRRLQGTSATLRWHSDIAASVLVKLGLTHVILHARMVPYLKPWPCISVMLSIATVQ